MSQCLAPFTTLIIHYLNYLPNLEAARSWKRFLKGDKVVCVCVRFHSCFETLNQMNLDRRKKLVFLVNTVLIFCLAQNKAISFSKSHFQHIHGHDPSEFSYRECIASTTSKADSWQKRAQTLGTTKGSSAEKYLEADLETEVYALCHRLVGV